MSSCDNKQLDNLLAYLHRENRLRHYVILYNDMGGMYVQQRSITDDQQVGDDDVSDPPSGEPQDAIAAGYAAWINDALRDFRVDAADQRKWYPFAAAAIGRDVAIYHKAR